MCACALCMCACALYVYIFTVYTSGQLSREFSWPVTYHSFKSIDCAIVLVIILHCYVVGEGLTLYTHAQKREGGREGGREKVCVCATLCACEREGVRERPRQN